MDAGQVRGQVALGALLLTIAASAPPAEAAVRHTWVAAVPATWNMVPTGRDVIMDRSFGVAETVFPTIV